MKSWTRTGLAASALMLTVVGCGAGGDAATDQQADKKNATSAPASPDGPADFCAQLTQVQSHLSLMDISLATDWSKFAGAAKGIGDLKPPAELAGAWTTVLDFYTYIAGLFDGVDFSDRDAVGDVLESKLGPDTEARAKKAEGAIGEVQKYVSSNCADAAGDAAPAARTDACTLLEDDELKTVFPTGLPQARSQTYGPDTMECIWKTDAAEASIMIVPIADFTREYLEKSTPLPAGTIDGLTGGNTFKGVLGIGRFNTRGHSVSFTHHDVGGFVSVRHGQTDSRAVEVGTATKLAKIVVGRL